MTIRYENRDELCVFTIDNRKLNPVTVAMHRPPDPAKNMEPLIKETGDQ